MGSIFEVTNYGNEQRVAHASWEGTNEIRVASNKREASDVALKEFSRTLGNQRIMEAAGKQYNDASENLTRELGAKVFTDINLSMAEAQMQGSIAAQASALGVGGSSVDLIDAASALQADTQRQVADDNAFSANVVGSRAKAQGIDNAVAAMDNSTFRGNYDYSTQLEPAKLHNRVGAYIGMAGAFFLGGPSGSEGAADITMGSLAAQNGDSKSAKAYFQSAAQNAANAYKDWQSVQDDDSDGPKSWFAGMRDSAKKAEDFKKEADDNSKDGGSWWSSLFGK